jgi:hypothetical protein
MDLDFEGLAQTSVERLAALGHRRIAVALPDDNLAHVYHRAALEALRDQDLPAGPDRIVTVPGEEGGLSPARRLLAWPDRPPRSTAPNPSCRALIPGLPRRGRRRVGTFGRAAFATVRGCATFPRLPLTPS